MQPFEVCSTPRLRRRASGRAWRPAAAGCAAGGAGVGPLVASWRASPGGGAGPRRGRPAGDLSVAGIRELMRRRADEKRRSGRAAEPALGPVFKAILRAGLGESGLVHNLQVQQSLRHASTVSVLLSGASGMFAWFCGTPRACGLLRSLLFRRHGGHHARRGWRPPPRCSASSAPAAGSSSRSRSTGRAGAPRPCRRRAARSGPSTPWRRAAAHVGGGAAARPRRRRGARAGRPRGRAPARAGERGVPGDGQRVGGRDRRAGLSHRRPSPRRPRRARREAVSSRADRFSSCRGSSVTTVNSQRAGLDVDSAGEFGGSTGQCSRIF
ncbi:unnamed protein product [Prorocentrum cordatum]|uniref:Uncharacterized protein n=1 Tax=Prorocentrum cordatum TaxID=2364126 RepID=A0ABN9T6L4_9DINO|nr:unnamed protein product [Polarella glacialis]